MSVPELASVDGVVTTSEHATIPATDEGLLRGDGVFEVIRLYRGRPFALAEHLDRLERSARAIQLPVERAKLERDLEPLLRQLGEHDGQLRLVVTRGGRHLAFTEPLPSRGESVRLAVVIYQPTMILTGVKSLSYAANMQATRIAQLELADEAVLVRPDGIVLEAPTSSIFWVSAEGVLKTPSIDCGILESITRDRIVHELEVEQGRFEAADLRSAREAFLASTTREVQPVASIDGQPLPEVPGPRTREAQNSFERVRDAELARP